MDSADDVDPRPPDQWLLDTLRGVSRALTDAVDTPALARRLPGALVAVPENTTAWIGHPRRSAAAIRVRTASEDLPDRIGVAGGRTREVLDADAPHLGEAGECPEYSHLADAGTIPEATTALVVPLSTLQHDAVLHVYTDGDHAELETGDLTNDIAALLRTGFEHHEMARECTRERERLEALRSLVSHDLGNPINIAAGRLDLVRTECESEHIGHVESALADLESLADEGLLFVKAGRELDEQSDLALGQFARECWDLVDAPDSDLSVEPTTVYAEPERFRMLLNQLFDNAVVHADSPVTVSVGPLAEDRGFSVEDDGPGIPQNHLPYVFDRGYTTDSNRDGNGLALVDEIADALGWTAEITEADDGTRVEITTAAWEG